MMPNTLLVFLLVVLGSRPARPDERRRPFLAVEEISVDPEAVLPSLEEFHPDPKDWTSWRGPLGNGVALSPTAPTNWSETENVVWSTPVPGRGHGSPTIRGDLVILAAALPESQRQMVLAYDRHTGAERWRTVLHQGNFTPQRWMHGHSTHANCTPACDDRHVYCVFLNDAQVVATALDLRGKVVWQTRLGPFDSKFGYAPSPTIHESLVLVAADNWGGGFLAAVHRATGEIVWRKRRSTASTYSSPVVANIGGRDQLLMSGNQQVRGYDPDTGELLWSTAGASTQTVGTMVWSDDIVFASGGYPERETVAVRVGSTPEVLWRSGVRVYEPSMLVVGGALFAVTENGIGHCWDCASGELQWRQRLGGNFSASPVLCDNCIYITSEKGKTIVFEATAEQYEPVAVNWLGDDTFASPVICNGQVFLRVGVGESDDRQEMLYCLGSATSRHAAEPEELGK